MATIFKLTITIGSGDDARQREISIDPETIPMGVLEDMEDLGAARDWKSIRPIIQGLFNLSKEEFRAMTARQFMDVAEALRASVGSATTIPNETASPSS
jgi:hypothetical protein